MQYGLWDVDVVEMTTVVTAHLDVETFVVLVAASGEKLVSEAE